MSAHTPGPWRDEAVTQRMADEMRGPLPQDFILVGGDGTAIGILYDFADRAPANARLIAAAPGLLAACRLTALHFARVAASDQWMGDDEHEAWSALTAALQSVSGSPEDAK